MGMIAKWKELWIKALRSGDYKQTKQRLKDVEGYCCLGVLCEVAGAEWVHSVADGGSWIYPKIKSDGVEIEIGSRSLLTAAGKDLFGLGKNYGDISDVGRLMNMNDEQGKTFAEIADYIEENL